ncbi:MAG TPA: Gfo/Idh/MocA family oxidoreductase [Verrucomicrobiae bacterium]
MNAAVLEKETSGEKARKRLPRLGFLGVGWIGRKRLEAITQTGMAAVAAIADPAPALLVEAAKSAPGAACLASMEELLEEDLDGVVIATPSALHAQQAERAIRQGLPVFCQKPLGRNTAENRRVIEAAREMDVLLGVDLSYRFINEVRTVVDLARSGELGKVYAAEFIFHNAYGPDKAWFYDPKLSGGGCVIDLGIHLVDLALWTLNFPRVQGSTSRLFAQGEPLAERERQVEDFAVARLDLETGAVVEVACSWKVHSGCDAIISGTFYGTEGGAQFRNVNGSFVDFTAERFYGTRRETSSSCQGGWGGLAAVDWALRLGRSSKYNPEIESLIAVSETLDAIYTSGAANKK